MKGEDAGVGCAAEREWGEGVGAPAKAAQGVAGVALDGSEAGVDGGSADGVVYDVEAFACRMFGEVLVNGGGPVVDGRGAEGFDDFLFVGGDGGEDFGSAGEGDLNGDVPYSSGSGVNQNGLAGVDASAIDKAFPGGDGAEREGCGLAHGEIPGLERQQVGVDGEVFGEGALMAAHTAGEAVDFIALVKRGNSGGGFDDGSGHVQAEDGGQRLLCVSCLTGADFGVERIEAGGGDADEDLARGERGAFQHG